MNIDPHELDDDALKLELDREMSELSHDDLGLLDTVRPRSSAPDEKGRISGTIISVRGDDVFVDIGGKSEAFLSVSEFDEGQPPQPGEQHRFVMQGLDRESGLMKLSLREARTEADLESLQVGDVIEARVTGVNLGGLELVTKSIRGFMPKSQVDLERIEDFTPYIGRKLECYVSEIDRRGRRVVLSHRRVLERQRQEQSEQLRYSLEEGQIRPGVVRRLTDFGAFVDLGGIDGLLHVSDIAYARIGHPKEVLKVGDQVEVQVLKIDLVKNRISLGMKQLKPDPWNVAGANYLAGNNADGRVVKLMDFGAFVELEPGIEGLIPVSEISWTKRVNHPKDVLAVGDPVRVTVMSVDVDQHRISLSLKAQSEDPWNSVEERYKEDDVVSGAVSRLTDFGAFIQLEDGVDGLVHVSELSDKHVRRPSEVVKVGEVVKVRVKSVDREQRRISLSMKSAVEGAAVSGDSTGAPDAPPLPKKLRKKPLRGGLEFH